MRVIQVNLQTHFGGGEVYTGFLCRALSQLGVATRLLHHRDAGFWPRVGLPADTELVAVGGPDELASALPSEREWVLVHGALPRGIGAPHLVTAIAHMPVQGRNPEQYRGADKVFAVSAYVLEGLQAAGIDAWPQPLYGVADLRGRTDGASVLRRQSCHDWDRRKVRDRLLGLLEPLVEPLRPHPAFAKRPGLTLGIVSRLTPIKQFPHLFGLLAPVMARRPDINLEIFGAGGYASVRDLRRALQPLGGRARFWGHQDDVVAAYRNIDYLMTGLPEKEALGLNVIEAQAAGVPVLAPRAPPFTETVVDGLTGHFYRDPREDKGADFAALLERIAGGPRPDPRRAVQHLEKFSAASFAERVKPVAAWAAEALRRAG